MAKVSVPFRYSPRGYQLPFWKAMLPRRFNPDSHARAHKRAVLVWHRRAGKDKTALNFLIDQAAGASARIGTYYYFYPYANQARKALWEGKGKDGMKFMHHFPGFEEPDSEGSIVLSKRETDMYIALRDPRDPAVEGSSFQIIGTDNFDSIRSTNPVGCVFSEYGDQDPRAWDTVKPILRENGGWAVFVYTPKGANHGKKLYEMACREDDWYAELLTIEDTFRDAEADRTDPEFGHLYGQPVFTRADYEKEIAEGTDEEFARQEYYCSFSGNVVGSYYGRALDRHEKFVRAVPWEPRLPVHTAWDLGVDDMMAIWFFQLPDGPDGQVRLIEYLEGRNEGLGFYAKEMHTRPYLYGTHLLPHDASKRNPQERTPAEHLEGLGLRPVVVVGKGNPVAGIDNARALIPRCVADAGKTGRGVECLRNYRKNLDPKKDTFGSPVHDWASHGADAFRTLAEGIEMVSDEAPNQKFADSKFTGYDDVDGLQRQLDDFDPYESRR